MAVFAPRHRPRLEHAGNPLNGGIVATIIVLAIPLGLLAAGIAPIIDTRDGLNIHGGPAPWVAMIAGLLLLAPTILVWRSRWNLLALTQLELVIAAYVVPLLFVNTLSQWPATTVHMYVGILTLGAVMISAGVVVGNLAGQHSVGVNRWLGRRIAALDDTTAIKRIWAVGVGSVLLMAAAFAALHFIPIIASNPTAAKYLAPPYGVSRKVGFLYHLAVPAASTAIVLVLGAAWRTRQPRFYGLSVVLFLELIGTNQRAYAITGVLSILLVAGAARWIKLAPVIALTLIIGPFGSASGFILSNDLGLHQFARNNQGTTLAKAVASGAPDVHDDLLTLGYFLDAPQYTHGRTFYSALSYVGSPWAPAQWGLREENPNVDLSKIQSGGVRFPAAFWGYFAFGWWGAAIVSLISGLAAGFVVGIVRRFIGNGTFLQAVVLAGLLLSVGVWAQNFYLTDWLKVATCVPVLAVLLGRPGRFRGS